jgi:hypothetical protein
MADYKDDLYFMRGGYKNNKTLRSKHKRRSSKRKTKKTKKNTN